MAVTMDKEKLKARFSELLDVFHGHDYFMDVVLDLVELHSNKNRQYANIEDPLGNFRRRGDANIKLFNPSFSEDQYKRMMAYALVLMDKQVDGVKEILGENKKNTCDTFEEKLFDIAVYSMIAAVINRVKEDGGKEKKNTIDDDDLALSRLSWCSVVNSCRGLKQKLKWLHLWLVG